MAEPLPSFKKLLANADLAEVAAALREVRDAGMRGTDGLDVLRAAARGAETEPTDG
jgi:hypothetical protein